MKRFSNQLLHQIPIFLNQGFQTGRNCFRLFARGHGSLQRGEGQCFGRHKPSYHGPFLFPKLFAHNSVRYHMRTYHKSEPGLKRLLGQSLVNVRL
ncbi:hypothetical protein LFML04_0013 [Leptospirillum ferriphilum ML-04]|uniref:Uncharacterized protein n=1 Tax=Leptospirillum ferriphilum (strain ML-04) TaxID=1048260 RepID=J9Z9D5_LEPFM|nr:hypothetical protein LFML04_0013 [Leptospirillum ferriphilum ML-04]